MPKDELWDKGLRIRRQVVGDAHVNRSLADMDDVSAPLQELVVRYAWGEVWGREDKLDRRYRSTLNIGMLIALNRGHELKLHLRGAAANGLSRGEISELILQSAIYCGVAAALEAMRIFKDVLLEDAAVKAP